jgi:hypothetical protein
MNETRREHGPGRADRVAVRDGAALDVDDVRRQAKLAHHRDDDGREGLVDLNPLHRAETPTPTVQRLFDGRDRAEAEHPGLDGGDAVGDEPGHRRETTLLRPGFIGQHHRGGQGIALAIETIA